MTYTFSKGGSENIIQITHFPYRNFLNIRYFSVARLFFFFFLDKIRKNVKGAPENVGSFYDKNAQELI